MFVICFYYTLIALIAITNLRYADDTTLLASTQERIRKFFKDLIRESACYNMYINAQKSKIMVVSRQDKISGQVDHEGESLELVHDFKFLGSYATFYGCPLSISGRPCYILPMFFYLFFFMAALFSSPG